jgi:4-azaleucine resistance transporter AzlC
MSRSSVIRSEILAGVRAELPIVVGVIPFGMIFGAVAVAGGVPSLLAQSMSAVIFAGSAQFIAADLIANGTSALILLTTTFIVNLRHLLYSASLAPHVRHLPWRWRLFLAYLLTDEAYAVTIQHYNDPGSPHSVRHWFFLSAGLTLWVSWQLSTAIGISLGARIPADWSLDFVLALTFIAIIVPSLRDRPQIAAALAAGVFALLAASLPYRLGLMAAALAGMMAGVLLEGSGRQMSQDSPSSRGAPP